MTPAFIAFINALTKTRCQWLLRKGGQIRAGEFAGSDCPHLAVLHHGLMADDAIPFVLKHAIWEAADNKPRHDPAIRTALLLATGLAAPSKKTPKTA